MLIGIDGNEANTRKRVGSNVYAYQLLKYFAKSSSDKFIIYLKDKPLADLPKENSIWKYKILSPSPFWTRARLPLELYFNNPRSNVFFTPGHYAPKFCPSPLVISIMDLSFLFYPDMFKRQDLYKLTSWTLESIEKASHIFTISKSSKNDIINRYSVPEAKITVTYPGLDVSKLNKKLSDNDINKVKHKYSINKKYILYVGTIQPRKNLKRLVQAFSELNNQEINLVIVGKKGWLYEDLFKQIKTLKMENKIIFTGFVPKLETQALIMGSESLVLISLYEGFGIPALEAMFLGKPVIISNNSSLPEITGKIGIKVDPNSVKSILRGISRSLQLNELQRKEIFVKSKRRAELFSWEKTAEKTLEVLHDVAI